MVSAEFLQKQQCTKSLPSADSDSGMGGVALRILNIAACSIKQFINIYKRENHYTVVNEQRYIISISWAIRYKAFHHEQDDMLTKNLQQGES